MRDRFFAVCCDCCFSFHKVFFFNRLRYHRDTMMQRAFGGLFTFLLFVHFTTKCFLRRNKMLILEFVILFLSWQNPLSAITICVVVFSAVLHTHYGTFQPHGEYFPIDRRANKIRKTAKRKKKVPGWNLK